MALKVWIVEVFSVEDNLMVPKYNRKVKLRAEYDPQGINLKLLEMDESNQLLEFPVDADTDCCKVGTTSYLFAIENDTILIKFSNRDEARYFTIAITKIKSGKDASIFSVRTEDSSAAQYFQFYGYLSQQQNMLQVNVKLFQQL